MALALILALAPDAGARTDAARLRQALQRAVTDRTVRGSLRLLVECRRDAALQSAKVFGSGIGIWNDKRQFHLDHPEMARLLRVLQAADFPGLPDSYGGRQSGEQFATMITCRIALTVGRFDKQVAQLDGGEQSPVLKRLAEDLLGICEAPARSGVGASSLGDGLQKISRGELAPETWAVVLHRRPETRRARESPPGFLLRLAGSEATAQEYEPARGYRAAVVAGLSPDEVRRLAGEMAARDPAAWPDNLYARDYTDLTVEVLDHGKTIQARQFAGMGPATHGRPQTAFEEVFESLHRLYRTVLARGRRTPGRAGP